MANGNDLNQDQIDPGLLQQIQEFLQFLGTHPSGGFVGEEDAPAAQALQGAGRALSLQDLALLIDSVGGMLEGPKGTGGTRGAQSIVGPGGIGELRRTTDPQMIGAAGRAESIFGGGRTALGGEVTPQRIEDLVVQPAARGADLAERSGGRFAHLLRRAAGLAGGGSTPLNMNVIGQARRALAPAAKFAGPLGMAAGVALDIPAALERREDPDTHASFRSLVEDVQRRARGTTPRTTARRPRAVRRAAEVAKQASTRRSGGGGSKRTV